MSETGLDHLGGHSNPAGTDTEMDALRTAIDEVDAQIVRLLDQRASHARRIGEIKTARGLPTYVPSRERKVLKRVFALSDGGFPRQGLEAVFREIISSSISLEEPLKVAYLGPETTFTHEAALRSFGKSIDLMPLGTVAEVFAQVENSEAQHGVVPVENSMEGAVTQTLNELMNSPLKICGEIYIPISQNLVSRESSLEDIEVVYSHQMALAQAGTWLRQELPNARIEEASSTGEAARIAASEPGVAAVASVLAAETLGLSVLARNIQDVRANATRFIVLGDKWAGPTGNDKTSVVFSVKDRPGVLRDALSAFSDEGISFTRIESRPSRKRAWTYVFFGDFSGHPEEEHVRRALAKVEDFCPYVSVIGAYPAGNASSPENDPDGIPND